MGTPAVISRKEKRHTDREPPAPGSRKASSVKTEKSIMYPPTLVMESKLSIIQASSTSKEKGALLAPGGLLNFPRRSRPGAHLPRNIR